MGEEAVRPSQVKSPLLRGVLDGIPVADAWGCEWRDETALFAKAVRRASGRVDVRRFAVSRAEVNGFCRHWSLDRRGVHAASWALVHKARACLDAERGEDWIDSEEARLRDLGLPEGVSWGEQIDGLAYLVRLPDAVAWVDFLPENARGLLSLVPAQLVLAKRISSLAHLPEGDWTLLVPMQRWSLVLRFAGSQLAASGRFPWGTRDTRTEEEQRAVLADLRNDLGGRAPLRHLDLESALPEMAERLLEEIGSERWAFDPGEAPLDIASDLAVRAVSEHLQIGLPITPSLAMVQAGAIFSWIRKVRNLALIGLVPLIGAFWGVDRLAASAPPEPPERWKAQVEHFRRHPALSSSLEGRLQDWERPGMVRSWSLVRGDTAIHHEVLAEFPDRDVFHQWHNSHPAWHLRAMRTTPERGVSVTLELHESP